MKKVLIFVLIFTIQAALPQKNFPINPLKSIAYAETLRAGAVYDVIPKGFFGTWKVFSKMESSNNPSMFNKISVDIWNLSGAGNVLVLENAITGAKSSIQIESNKGSYDGKTLKFQRIKEEVSGNIKYIQKESPEFVLDGNTFKGFDTFIVEKYKENKLISKDVVKYVVIGKKVSGESKINGW